MKKINIVFLGRGTLGFEVLKRLIVEPDINLKAIISCKESVEVGLSQSDFEKFANDNGIMYVSENNINKEFYRNLFIDLSIDLAVAILWLYNISDEIIKSTKYGVLNLHGGQLPRYRGNACQTWAILNNEEKIGVTCHLMEGNSFDSGPIVRQEFFQVNENDKVGDLIIKIESIGINLVMDSVMDFVNDKVNIKFQDPSKSLYCYPRLPRDGEIDWNDSSSNINKLIRAAGRPYPGAYSYFSDSKDNNKIKKLIIYECEIINYPYNEINCVPGHLVKLDSGKMWAIKCGDSRLIKLLDITIDGKKIQPEDFFRSVRQRIGLDLNGIIYDLSKKIDELECIIKSSNQINS
jgi:methionyl-tRNA formyltransferase